MLRGSRKTFGGKFSVFGYTDSTTGIYQSEAPYETRYSIKVIISYFESLTNFKTEGIS